MNITTSNKNNIKLTIFTPAYNRIHTLPRTYESLLCQDYKEFIWLIVDDGSSDGTKELVQKWQSQDNGFEIRYVYKENGGMHTAHNVAYTNIYTELNTCIDSDDCLAPNAVSKILKKWSQVKDKGYAGIIGLDADLNTKKIIGKGFPENLTETTLSGYYANGGSGDKKLIYRTDLIKQYPAYPVFPDEKYVSLAYKYLLIDQDYKLAVLNEVLCEVEYQPDGSSMNMIRQYYKNPRGFAFWRVIKMQYPESKKRLILDCIHYCSSSILARNPNYISQSPYKPLTLLCTPFGVILSLYILLKARGK